MSVGIFLKLNDNDLTTIETIHALQETKSKLTVIESNSNKSVRVNNISIQDLKSSFRDIVLELLQEQEKNKVSLSYQQQNSIKKNKALLSATQMQQQQNNIELAKSYITRAISDGAWNNSDVYNFQAVSSTIPTADLTKILSPFYMAINNGSIVRETGTMLF